MTGRSKSDENQIKMTGSIDNQFKGCCPKTQRQPGGEEVLYSTLLSTAEYRYILYTVQYSTVQYSTALYSTVQYYTEQ